MKQFHEKAIAPRTVVFVLTVELLLIGMSAWVYEGMPLLNRELGPPAVTIHFERPTPPLAGGTRNT